MQKAAISVTNERMRVSPRERSGDHGAPASERVGGGRGGEAPRTKMSATLARAEAADYYATYINQVPDGEICAVLEVQLEDSAAILSGISEARSLHRYAPGKWTIKEVLGHINDTERVFAFRAFWFGRGCGEPMPSFDQDVAVASAASNDRLWVSHVAEFRAIRAATLALFSQLPADAWARRGVASGHPVSVRALAYITAGHLAHHMRILREQYLR